MASRQKKDGGDFVLESRHLVGLFFLLVVIFGVVFTLGYLLGRRQYDSALHADAAKSLDADAPDLPPPAKTRNKAEDVETLPPQKNSDWDFYHSAEPKTSEDHLQPPPKVVAPVKPAVDPKSTPKAAAVVPSKTVPAEPPATVPATGKSAGSLNGPLIPKGNIMLQVAALQRQEDALALAQALQQKKFPAFVITPGADKYYRVQVGPYADSKSANAARQDLEAKGFKSIIKR
jgi:cell division septation protein DedD